jgi:antitoxin MazE
MYKQEEHVRLQSHVGFEGTVQQWGNSLALRITRAVSELAQLPKGAKVRMQVTEHGLLIRPLAEKPESFAEDELLAGLTPHTAHADELPRLLTSEYRA